MLHFTDNMIFLSFTKSSFLDIGNGMGRLRAGVNVPE